MSAAPARSAFALPFAKGSKAYDLIAATPLILWYALAVTASLHPLGEQIGRLFARPDLTLCFTVLSKFAVLLFALVAISLLFLRRPPQSSAQGWMPRAAGLLGTYLSVGIVLLPPRQLAPVWLGISTVLILCGMAFACYAISYLGRSFSVMAEARRLVTGGPYSTVRHPLYLGEAIAMLGAVIPYLSPLALALFALQLGCQLCRMHWEEQVLAGTFPEYRDYQARTARLLPGVY